MSARCMAAVFDRYPVGGGEFVLALALADNAHDDGTHIFPSVETMAAKSRQSVRSVQMHLRAMQSSGWLQRVRSGGGRGLQAEYRISAAWIKGADIAPFQNKDETGQNPADIAPFSPEKGCRTKQERVQNNVQKGAEQRTPYITRLTSIEPTPLPPANAGGADGFDDFISTYPRRVGVNAARQVWETLLPDESLRKRISLAVRAWARSPEWARNDGQFIPKPARWLREARWDDVPGLSHVTVPAEPPALTPARQLSADELKANRARADAAMAALGFVAKPQRTMPANTGRSVSGVAA